MITVAVKSEKFCCQAGCAQLQQILLTVVSFCLSREYLWSDMKWIGCLSICYQCVSL